MVSELADERFRLDALSEDGDERASVRAVFDWSYQRLSAEQARLFRRLGLHPGEEFSVEAAAAVAELDLHDAQRVLAALARAHLIESVASRRRYRFHDLLRAYAADRAKRDDSSVERAHARTALLTWYAHHAKAALRTLFPAHRDWDPALRLTTSTSPEIRLSEHEETWAWTDVEVDNLVAATRHADQHEETSLTLLLVSTTTMILHRRGRWDDLFDLYSRGLRAARRSGSRLAEIQALINVGETSQLLGQWRGAEGVLLAALDMARDSEEQWWEATALLQLGDGYLAQEDYAQARDCLLAALPLAPGAQHGRIEAQIESDLSEVCLQLGDYQGALQHAGRGFVLSQRAGDREGEAGILCAMAMSHHSLGDTHRAIELCEQALGIVSHKFFPTSVAHVLDTLGVVLRESGDIARALDCWREALRIYGDTRHKRAERVRERLRALKLLLACLHRLDETVVSDYPAQLSCPEMGQHFAAISTNTLPHPLIRSSARRHERAPGPPVRPSLTGPRNRRTWLT
ncbi:tetratricopeptide repeat protein [Amycolatopsis sp. NPDC024027]|uniref:tetratricopeptide repeat protein n=1 Tax=Amycolatopsis sp. NPDC024027 TaxID=3154327 RepID=UPI0033D2BFCE